MGNEASGIDWSNDSAVVRAAIADVRNSFWREDQYVISSGSYNPQIIYGEGENATEAWAAARRHPTVVAFEASRRAPEDATEGKPKCGKPAASFIPRWGMSFACVLPEGHECGHKPQSARPLAVTVDGWVKRAEAAELALSSSRADALKDVRDELAVIEQHRKDAQDPQFLRDMTQRKAALENVEQAILARMEKAS